MKKIEFFTARWSGLTDSTRLEIRKATDNLAEKPEIIEYDISNENDEKKLKDYFKKFGYGEKILSIPVVVVNEDNIIFGFNGELKDKIRKFLAG